MSQLASEVREHMDVHSSDDKHIGRVDKVVGDKIELAKLDFSTGFKHRYIPLDWIAVIEGDKIVLSLTGDEAKERWTDEA
jgi:hypothetical protein